MRNRAKCKLCGDILESFHQFDYVTCRCGEISISGGNYSYECAFKHAENFLRVDDEGNEIIVKVVDKLTNEEENAIAKKAYDDAKEEAVLSKREKLQMLDDMILNIEKLPEGAMTAPVTHYDLYSALLLLSSILKDS